MAGLVLVAPALPTNDPKNSWSTGGGLGRKLRFAAVRWILQVHHLRRPCAQLWPQLHPSSLCRVHLQSSSTQVLVIEWRNRSAKVEGMRNHMGHKVLPCTAWSTLRYCCTMQMDGPGLHYIRASYRKQAAQVAAGSSRMLRSRLPAEAQAGPILTPTLAALLA